MHAALTRSPHAHAAVLAVDTAAALRSTGVVDVLTAADLPGQFWTGPVRADRPVLAAGVVRHVGEPVAAVLATDPASATRAAYAVAVEYRALPEVCWFRGDAADPLHPDGNVVRAVHVRRGEWPTVAGTVVEGSYNTHGWIPRQERFGTDGAPAVPALIEAEPTDTGVRIAAPRRWHPEDRDQIAQCLNLIPRQVELRSTGTRDHSTDLGSPVLAALFARRHHRSVSLVVGPSTHGQGGGPAVLARYRHHVRPDGTLAAVSGEIEVEVGPYAGIAESLVAELCAVGVGPYRVPAVDLRVRALRSTTPPPLIEPGAAAAAVAFAVEAQLDRLSDLLSYPEGREASRFLADRRAIRERNLLGLDDPLPTGQLPLEASPVPALLALLDAAPLPPMPDGGRDHAWGVGAGLGLVPFGVAEGFPVPVTATVDLRAGTVSCPAAEGDESREAAAVAVAGRAFDVPMRFAATGEPAPGGSAASVGGAVAAVVEALTAPARERLGAKVGLSPALLRAGAGRLRSFDGVVDVPLADALAGDPGAAEATYVPPDTEVLDGDGQGDAFAGFSYAAARAVLSLSARGKVEVVQLDVAADCGQVLDAARARAAVEASVSTGVRLALPEATVRPDAVRVHLHDGSAPKGAAGVAAGAVAAALRAAHDAGAGGDAEVLPIPGVAWSSS
nr:molybdopterin cofactor-binding domain-containing protein [Sporichthya polymorpha]